MICLQEYRKLPIDVHIRPQTHLSILDASPRTAGMRWMLEVKSGVYVPIHAAQINFGP